MDKKTLIDAINATPAQSAWEKGVKQYAVDVVNRIEHATNFDQKGLHEALLSGARDWQQYSHGACALVEDDHIAARLCSPSELRATKNGARNPDAFENWLDVQARALLQAERLIKSLF